MKSMKSLIGIVLVSVLFTMTSCVKESFAPNKEVVSSDDVVNSEKVHEMEETNELDFVFYVSDTNVNGTIEIYQDSKLHSVYDISDLPLESTTNYSGVQGDAFHIRFNIGNTQDDTQFQIVADFVREVTVRNENFINDDYMFRNNNRDFLEPSFDSGTGVTFTNSAWVLPTTLTYERVEYVR